MIELFLEVIMADSVKIFFVIKKFFVVAEIRKRDETTSKKEFCYNIRASRKQLTKMLFIFFHRSQNNAKSARGK